VKKILVVDDERDIVDTVVFALEREGYECVVAGDGIEALNKCRAEKPDCVIMDVKMPKMDGYKACRLLKFDEQLAHIPVIMLTARAQEQDRATGIETGADEYLIKPFHLADLVKIVRSYVDGREGDRTSQPGPGGPAESVDSQRPPQTVSPGERHQ